MKVAVILAITLAAFGAGLYGVKMVLPDAAEGGAELAAGDSAAVAATPEARARLAADSAATASQVTLDELGELRQQLASTQERIPTLLQRIDQLEQELTVRQDRQERAKELASSVSRLEDDELRDVLVQLDGRVLVDLYTQASSRNRTKMLAALPAGASAALVELVAYGSSRPRSAAPARSASSRSTSPRPAPAPRPTTPPADSSRASA
ncbi:hypothetical protein RQM47_11830 [Rubrivirga sp. S365]|uniref:hypothetical protein n=1 Tax=Rubrivirga sp. S365 TaxID=3076080 RepID=UPI0028C61293|nr:hypothetical protein [Rubrivirga sp. S365]MDT7857331.1 hypothetical protein [Rubrivirga sp. S365]